MSTIRPARSTPATANPPSDNLSPARCKELEKLVTEISTGIRFATKGALLVGLRILAVEREGGGRRAAISGFLDQLGVSERTCYRWSNAAGAALVQSLGLDDPDVLMIPAWDPKSAAWKGVEELMEQTAARSSIRRLILGGAGLKHDGDMTRIDHLIDQAEMGDPHAEEVLRKMDEGVLSPVQAVRAAAGAAATKGKQRNDPVYLTIDGRTGEPRGLFCKSCVTLRYAFARWEHLEEPARRKARKVWQELVEDLPHELR